MKIEITTIGFLSGITMLIIAALTLNGKLQEIINFESVEAEIFLFVFTSTFGVLFTFSSIKKL